MKFTLALIPAIVYLASGPVQPGFENHNPSGWYVTGDDSTKKEVFTIVEQMPQYNGGNEAMAKYIRENLKYPEQAQRDSIQGKVFVTFVVDDTGDVTKVKILRGLSPEIDTEAIRVVSEMPDWIPGMQSGKKVSVQYNLPLNFRLE